MDTATVIHWLHSAIFLRLEFKIFAVTIFLKPSMQAWIPLWKPGKLIQKQPIKH